MLHGCFYRFAEDTRSLTTKYLPQIGLDTQATILATNSRTTVSQTFVNPSSTEAIPEVFYSFPLYESSSIVGFTCRVGDNVIEGTVKPKAKANEIYEEAKSKGRNAAILDQSVNAADVFSTRLGNVPAGVTVLIEITLIQKLSQDTQTDGIRYTIPVTIAPRYGNGSGKSDVPKGVLVKTAIKVDVVMEKGSKIRNIRSPSHPIQVDLGRASDMPESTFESCYASVKLRENVVIDEDFVLTVNADKHDLPFAFLETHPTLPNQQALMLSLVPKFSLPPDASEIIFVIDRSGSMVDKIPTLLSALKLFLKSLPLGVPFNIISFGSEHKSLWPRSKMSSRESLEEALKHTKSVRANMGGTEILGALQAAVENRYKDKVLEVLILTDGEVWNQDEIFDLVNRENQENSARFFTLGLGNSVSHSLINGISRAGKGFSQSVLNNEDLNKTVVRMLKGALMPRLRNSKLDMNIPELEDFVEVELPGDDNGQTESSAKPISFFDQDHKEKEDVGDVQEPLPKLSVPSILQAPADLPALFPFIRSTIYVLLSQPSESFPETITLRVDSKHGPLELEIPVQDVGKGQTLHQLAAKKAITELEESRGWIHSAKDAEGNLIKSKWESRVDELVQKECERLGVMFQVAGKHCSFVAVHDDDPMNPEHNSRTDTELEYVSLQSGPDHQAGYRMASPGPWDISRKRRRHSVGGKRMRRAVATTQCDEEPGVDEPESDVCEEVASPGFSFTIPSYCPASSNGAPYKPGGALKSARDVSDNDDDNDDASVHSSTSSPKTMPLQKLISLQTFDGYWDIDDELLQTVGLDPRTTRAKLQSHYDFLKGSMATEVSALDQWFKILATCLVCHFLENKASESKDVWELVKTKADGWVQDELNAMDSTDQQIVMKLIDGLGSYF
ncbi:von Willebrand factor type A [Penicillium cinerascens]|uniref:von Willebrand factor type A n=1 Tax=Penicillium cinerascens TaxID=70096 RepID=A0A9W9SXL3_9EURO|nr:von Willebrand factor type A [Penicillium cinerascens]KAJ5202024.1 von Willebrand factor type A [Penicillium cinerascens]